MAESDFDDMAACDDIGDGWSPSEDEREEYARRHFPIIVTDATAGVERTEVVLDDVRREVSRSIAKHGAQVEVPMGTGPYSHPLEFHEARVFHNDFAKLLAEIAKQSTDARTVAGTLSWRDILLEEVMEAFAEEDPEKLRAELVQVAAVAVKMCEVLDRG